MDNLTLACTNRALGCEHEVQLKNAEIMLYHETNACQHTPSTMTFCGITLCEWSGENQFLAQHQQNAECFSWTKAFLQNEITKQKDTYETNIRNNEMLHRTKMDEMVKRVLASKNKNKFQLQESYEKHWRI